MFYIYSVKLKVRSVTHLRRVTHQRLSDTLIMQVTALLQLFFKRCVSNKQCRLDEQSKLNSTAWSQGWSACRSRNDRNECRFDSRGHHSRLWPGSLCQTRYVLLPCRPDCSGRVDVQKVRLCKFDHKSSVDRAVAQCYRRGSSDAAASRRHRHSSANSWWSDWKLHFRVWHLVCMLNAIFQYGIGVHL